MSLWLAACCIVASESFVHSHKLENQAIEIVGQALATDFPSAFDSRSAIELVGYSMSKAAADRVFAQAGFREGEGRDSVGVVELHDCFAANELIMYPALGLCEEGGAVKFVERGDNTVRRKGRLAVVCWAKLCTVWRKVCREPQRRSGSQGPPSGRNRSGHALLHHL